MARKGTRPRRLYRIVAAFDTETTELGDCAFAWAYVFAHCADAEEDADTPRVDIVRTEAEAMTQIRGIIAQGGQGGFIPVVVCYNAAFDLQTLRAEIRKEYGSDGVGIVAKSPQDIICFDIIQDGHKVMRFWDLHAVNPDGVAALGSIVGIPKLYGDLDYDKVRGMLTPITVEERAYMSHDVGILLRYVAWLKSSTPWLHPGDLGGIVTTGAGLIRVLALREIGSLKFKRSTGARVSLRKSYDARCKKDLPKDYATWELRRQAMRGGLSLTAPRLMGRVLHGVFSLDVTSEYHAFIDGIRIPESFRHANLDELQAAIDTTIHTPLSDILTHYAEPFRAALHARVVFHGLRLRPGTVWARDDMAIIGRDRFQSLKLATDTAQDYTADEADGPVFAWGKLYGAKTYTTVVSECELWCIAQAYTWDSMDVIDGEISTRWSQPPDYVSVQSNYFFEAKQSCKRIIADYRRGDVSRETLDVLPDALANRVKNGTATVEELESYYTFVKAEFNSIAGNQMSEIYRASWEMTDNAEIQIDPKTVLTPDNFGARKIGQCYINYPWGLRISGRGRMHLMCAVELIARECPATRIVSGDTDSLKIQLNGVKPSEVFAALEPLHIATREAIATNQRRLRRTFPGLASGLDGVGEFVAESEPYRDYYELYDKMRVYGDGRRIHVTAAGMPRSYAHVVGKVFEATGDFAKTAALCMSWNTCVMCPPLRNFDRIIPLAESTISRPIRDYLGEPEWIVAHKAVQLHPAPAWVGDTSHKVWRETLAWLGMHGMQPRELRPRYVVLDGNGRLCVLGSNPNRPPIWEDGNSEEH